MKKNNNHTGIFGIIGSVLLVFAIILLIFQPTSSGIYLAISSALSLVAFWIDRSKHHNAISIIGQYSALVVFVFAAIICVVYSNMK